ncbi:hypothetical protein NL676_005580 [Syzygium grande]|nr:hypothetical protein NL676_005580 [Syzygium grande]
MSTGWLRRHHPEEVLEAAHVDGATAPSGSAAPRGSREAMGGRSREEAGKGVLSIRQQSGIQCTDFAPTTQEDKFINRLILKFCSPDTGFTTMGKCIHVLDVFRKSLLSHEKKPKKVRHRLEDMGHERGDDIIQSVTELEENSLGSNKVVAKLFNSLSKDVTLKLNSSLNTVCKVNKYRKKPWNMWRANLIHTHFRNPFIVSCCRHLPLSLRAYYNTDCMYRVQLQQ